MQLTPLPRQLTRGRNVAATLLTRGCHMADTWLPRSMFGVQTDMSADMSANMSADMSIRGCQVSGVRGGRCRWRLLGGWPITGCYMDKTTWFAAVRALDPMHLEGANDW
ncbi:hypothetical protein Tco_1036525 [Tanacetum coccineum]